MVERESDLNSHLNIVRQLTPPILRALGCDLDQPNRQGILWQNFRELNTTFTVRNERYGLDLTQVPPKVIDFLRQFVGAAERKKEGDQELWNKFLEETKKLGDDFFNQPLGQFEDPNVTPLTLSQLNAALVDAILKRGVTFNFNGQQEKNK